MEYPGTLLQKSKCLFGLLGLKGRKRNQHAAKLVILKVAQFAASWEAFPVLACTTVKAHWTPCASRSQRTLTVKWDTLCPGLTAGTPRCYALLSPMHRQPYTESLLSDRTHLVRTDWESFVRVQQRKTLSLRVQLLACPSSRRCLQIKGRVCIWGQVGEHDCKQIVGSNTKSHSLHYHW